MEALARSEKCIGVLVGWFYSEMRAKFVSVFGSGIWDGAERVK